VILSSSRTSVAGEKENEESELSVCLRLYRIEQGLTSQSQFGMSLDRTDGSPEDVGWSDVNLVEQKESPLSRREELHHLGRRVRSFRGVGDHRVGRDHDSSVSSELIVVEAGSRKQVESGCERTRWRKRNETRRTFSFSSAVKTEICFSVMLDHWRNCCFHCMTDTLRS